nr:PHD finger protein MALE MEIOCYTE DEATH 1 [Ipomoea batatas]
MTKKKLPASGKGVLASRIRGRRRSCRRAGRGAANHFLLQKSQSNSAVHSSGSVQIHALSQVKRSSPSNSKTLFFKALDQDYYSEIGSYVVHRAVNRATRVLEYTLQE